MIKEILNNTKRILDLISAEVQPMSINIGQNRAEVLFQNKDISAVITDKDIILCKIKNNKYISSKRIMFGTTNFLTVSDIHKIEDFILYD